MKRTQRGWRPLSPVLWAALLAVCACGDPPAGPDEGGMLVVEPGHWLLVLGESESVDLAAVAGDAQGRPIPGIRPDWTSSDPDVVTVEPTGRVTAVSAGSARVAATWRGLSAEAVVEVWDRPAPDPGASDASQYGREHYTEYVPGELPLIVSAPHGGGLRPDEIPDRTWGVTAADRETVD
ncbi:MAG: hypothetical protein HKN73_07005, partial [Gemmatimonadetes bacterium]|nr:hypothetical protein [Gemmatimonadota bacterium]